MSYRLYYWPDIPGRGEFVRLALEAAAAPYADVAREPDGMAEMARLLESGDRPPFAPPFLADGRLVIGQTAAILLHLGDRHGLAPDDSAGRLWTHQIQLTIADLIEEAHSTHHPISGNLYYDDQRQEAARRARHFREDRMPQFLVWFERVLAANAGNGPWLVGAERSYADLSLFQVVEGLKHAFPIAAADALSVTPQVVQLCDAVADLPRIRAYLASDRRLAFNQSGIFRRYPELDG